MFTQSLRFVRPAAQQTARRCFAKAAAEKAAPKKAAAKAPKAAAEKAVAATEKAAAPKLRDLPMKERYEIRLAKAEASIARFEKRLAKLEVPEDQERVKQRISELSVQVKRVKSLQAKANRKELKEERLNKLPQADVLQAMGLNERLSLFTNVDPALNQPYHLFARNLKFTEPSVGFDAYMSSWKALSEAQRRPYVDAIAAVKAAKKLDAKH